MIRSTELIAVNARKENVRRKRYQNGSLQVVSTHGKRKMWILQYRDGGSKKYHTIGLYAKMSKSDAQQAQATFMKEGNARTASAPDPHVTFGDFLEGAALPFLRSKWKGSTRDTTENRIRHHLLAEFRREKLARLGLGRLQAFLGDKAATLSKSVVAHLRWDLRAIFRLAMAEGYIERDPTNLQVLRRTHASLGHKAKVDPKTAADQRGHGIGVALDVYTQSSIEARRGAAEMLEQSVLSGEKPETAKAEPETSGENRSVAA